MFQTLNPKEWTENVFSLWANRWTLITAGTQENCNTMTAAWGGLGVLWNKNVATIYVRPQRHTYTFLEEAPMFTLSFFGEEWREQLKYCGSHSGRDGDKIAACGFHVETAEAPYIAEAELVLVCKKLYFQDLDPANMGETALKHYKENDFHRMYIGEIVTALRRSDEPAAESRS